jgi:hypothetical protein
MPVLSYCLPVWGHCPISNQHAIDRTLKRCICYILNVNNACFSKQTFNDTGICTFAQFVEMNDAFTVFKYIHSPPFDDFSTIILLISVSQRAYRATESNKIVESHFKRKTDDLCFLSAGFKAWNCFPNCVFSCNNFNVFKNQLMKYFMTL